MTKWIAQWRPKHPSCQGFMIWIRITSCFSFFSLICFHYIISVEKPCIYSRHDIQFDIEFESPPEPGHYKINNSGDAKTPNISFWPGDQLINIAHKPYIKYDDPDPPLLFVTRKNGKLVFTFCEVTFVHSGTNTEYVINARIVAL